MSYHKSTYYCSFCGKSEHEVRRLITMARIAAICNECVGVCSEILREEGIEAELPHRYSLPHFSAIRQAIRKYMSK